MLWATLTDNSGCYLNGNERRSVAVHWSISSKLNCIQMNLRESSKAHKFLSKMLTEHRRIADSFLHRVKDFHISHIHTMFSNYKIVYNQTERIIDDAIKSELLRDDSRPS